MVLHALTGIDLGEKLADELTGFTPERGTWQFRMLLAFAQYGFCAIDHERIYVGDFVRDPAEALRRQLPRSIADEYIADTDIEGERQALLACLQSPMIQFVDAVPSLRDMRQQLDHGNYVLCTVNSCILAQQPGHRAHMVVVDELDDMTVKIQDPGLPPIFDRIVTVSDFAKAWTSGSPSAANMIVVVPKGPTETMPPSAL